MTLNQQLYIGGVWCGSASAETVAVHNPANGHALGTAPRGCTDDVNAAVAAARQAQPGWAATPAAERIAALDRIRAGLAARAEEAALLITREMGSPLSFSRLAQLGMPLKNLDFAARALAQWPEDECIGHTRVVRDPVGVVAAITPWNFPLHQITAKVAPALATGCTVVLKPSELTPFDAGLLAEVIHAAGLPPGVFNLVPGTGAAVGEALVRHPGVDMVSFTGSTLAGRRIATLAAETLKPTALELGGKSANVVLPGVDLAAVLVVALKQGWANSGQACACLSRLLVPQSLYAKAQELLVELATQWTVGDPMDPATKLGPLASRAQQTRVLALLDSGIADGCRVLTGGTAPMPGLEAGAYVRPTVLTGVRADMRVAREEIFGPVICLMPYADEDQAVAMANDSEYGLSGGVWAADAAEAERVARRLHTGQVVINGSPLNLQAPFGGVKHSGWGREYGPHGLQAYVQLKALQGAVRVAD
jgi:acyl-CoA reductase-like NAD-dependent aldehyde dehydrogenase